MPNLAPLIVSFLCLASAPPESTTPLDFVSAMETVLADAIQKAEGSVVAISRYKSEDEATTAIRGLEPPKPVDLDRRVPTINNLNVFSNEELSFDYGSGVVVGDKGEILTAFHVVKGANRLRVRANDRQGFDAEIIAADPRSDLAVIVPKEIPGQAGPKLKPILLGDSNKIRKGGFLIALGNPFNSARDGKPSASWGILSNIARRIEPTLEEQFEHRLQLRNYPTLLQLDSKLNLGMSGGAIINMKGELVGLTTAVANATGFDSQAGYAIPIDKLGRQVVETLKDGREYEYGFLGINLDMESNTNRVGSADPGSPAAEGGVQVNDLILGVGEIPVVDRDTLVVAINSVPAGEAVKFKISRRGSTIERTVRLAKLKVRADVIATNRPAPWRGIRVDYSSTMATSVFPSGLADALARQGVVVTEVGNGSEAEKAGLRIGRIISKVGEQSVKTPKEFADATTDLKGPVKLVTDVEEITVK